MNKTIFKYMKNQINKLNYILIKNIIIDIHFKNSIINKLQFKWKPNIDSYINYVVIQMKFIN